MDCVYIHMHRSSSSNEVAHHEQGEHESIVGSVVLRQVLPLATQLHGKRCVLCKDHHQTEQGRESEDKLLAQA